MRGSLPLEGGSPLGSPVGNPSNRVFAPVSAPSGPAALPTHHRASPVLAPASSAARRVSAQARARLATTLAERDWQVLERLREHGFLSSDQVQRFVFTDHASLATARRSCSRVLTRLQRDHLVAALPRRQGGPLGGSSPAVWQLTTAGRRLLNEQRPHQRALAPSHARLLHSLAVADVHLALREHLAANRREESPKVAIEPSAWRNFHGLGGERRVLKPDLYAELPGHDEHGAYVDRWFIEVDLGTESLPTLLRKCSQYEAYQASGIEQAAGGSMPLVLWVFTRAERAEALAQAVARRSGLTPAMYRYATFETLADVLSEAVS